MRAKIQKTHYLRLAVLTFSYLCSMKIGIIVAMDKEFIQLKSILEHTETEYRNHKEFVIGKVGNKDIVLQKCGIGKVNSAVGAVEIDKQL